MLINDASTKSAKQPSLCARLPTSISPHPPPPTYPQRFVATRNAVFEIPDSLADPEFAQSRDASVRVQPLQELYVKLAAGVRAEVKTIHAVFSEPRAALRAFVARLLREKVLTALETLLPSPLEALEEPDELALALQTLALAHDATRGLARKIAG